MVKITKNRRKVVEKSSNKKEARNILGNNIFVRAGIEKRLAINNGLAIEGKLNEFLNNKSITVEGTNGTVRQVALKEFSVNSEEFKGAISEFSETRKQDVMKDSPLSFHSLFCLYLSLHFVRGQR